MGKVTTRERMPLVVMEPALEHDQPGAVELADDQVAFVAGDGGRGEVGHAFDRGSRPRSVSPSASEPRPEPSTSGDRGNLRHGVAEDRCGFHRTSTPIRGR